MFFSRDERKRPQVNWSWLLGTNIVFYIDKYTYDGCRYSSDMAEGTVNALSDSYVKIGDRWYEKNKVNFELIRNN